MGEVKVLSSEFWVTVLPAIGPPELVVTRISAQPSEILLGQSTTIVFAVQNKGGMSGSGTVILAANNVEIGRVSVGPIEREQETEYRHTWKPGAKGTYTVRARMVDGEAAPETTVVVKAPASIKITAFGPQKPLLNLGETNTIFLTVGNEGDVTGSATITISVEGTLLLKDTPSLAGGEYRTFSAKYTPPSAGTYTARGTCDGASASATFTVQSPPPPPPPSPPPPAPNIRFEELRLSATSIPVGRPVEAYGKFRNYGDGAGSVSWVTSADGTVIGSGSVVINAGATIEQKVGIWTPSTAGTYTVRCTAAGTTLSATLTVQAQYTVVWSLRYNSNDVQPLYIPQQVTVPEGGTAGTTVSWKALKTGYHHVALYYLGSWKYVGFNWVGAAGGTVSMSVGVPNVRQNLDVTICIKVTTSSSQPSFP